MWIPSLSNKWTYSALILPIVVLSIILLGLGMNHYASYTAGPNMEVLCPPAIYHIPFWHLLLQLVVLFVAARVFGWVFAQVGMDAVLGEILAGILLGNSFFGWVAPDTYTLLFPKGSGRILFDIANVGFILFIFLVGLEYDWATLRKRWSNAIVVSHVGIACALLAGVAIAFITFPIFAPRGSDFEDYALLMSIAIGITSFPILTRMLRDRGIASTDLGELTMITAMISDVTIWLLVLLLFVVSRAETVWHGLMTLVLSVGYFVLMVWVVRPAMDRLFKPYDSYSPLHRASLMLISMAMIGASAYITHLIGIHAVVGAFAAGAIMPRDKGMHLYLLSEFKGLVKWVLLPLFFVIAGKRINMQLIHEGALWGWIIAIIVVAVLSKGVGTILGARISKIGWADSFRLSSLLNVKGLTLIVILNMCRDLRIVNKEGYTALMLMTLITTFAAPLVLHFINRREERLTTT